MPPTTLKMVPAPTTRAGNRAAWWIVALLSLMVAGYAGFYLVLGSRMYPAELMESFLARPWGIYTHALSGSIGLGLGPFQFRRSLVERRPELHRLMGKIYLVAALMVGISGVYMAIFSYAGWSTHLGFGFLGVGLIATSVAAYKTIRRFDVVSHREWVIRSFAFMFAAVTFRLWLGGLAGFSALEFEASYRLASWACWIPNMVVAEVYVRRTRNGAARRARPPLAQPARA